MTSLVKQNLFFSVNALAWRGVDGVSIYLTWGKAKPKGVGV